MNKVILIGRLTKDPEDKTGQRYTKTVRYTLAVDRFKRPSDKDAPSVDYIPCVAFDKGAEFALNWLHKGQKIAVVGRILTGSYKNKDGQTVYTQDVVVDSQEFVESKAIAEKKSVETGKKEVAEDGFLSIPMDIEEPDGLPFK